MLDNSKRHQIQEIKQIVQEIESDIEYDFKKDASRIISKQKDPYLKEILDSYQTNSALEQKYTASDILTILETIFDDLKLGEFEEYHENMESIENQDFTCTHCKNIISLESNQNLTKNNFNYCPHCGNLIED